MAIDVTSATEAYLRLVPPARDMIATEYTRGSHWLLLWSKLMALSVATVLARVDVVRLLPARLMPPSRPRVAAFWTSLSILACYLTLEMPWFAAADWYRERLYGFSHQPLVAWLAGYAIQSLVLSVAGAALLTIFYAAVRRGGPRWWLWGTAVAAMGLVLALIVQPILLVHLLQNHRPAPRGKMQAAVEELLVRTGAPGGEVLVYDGSRESSRYTATVTGFGSSATVLLSDSMFARGADVAEVRAVVAHELGHERHNHAILLAIVLTLVVGAGLLVTDRAFGPVARRLGMPQAALADPRTLPVLLAIFAAYTFVTTPLVNTTERLVEVDADRYGLELAQEPDGMARAVLATADYRASRPAFLEELLFYDHPSVRSRIEHAMRWKADHDRSADTSR
ncbi:M48 family metalloprotease [Sphingomonas sp. BK069]|uniref:M48 family metalloprotease n=1 Tax=Sphingomonas sp. BK069 TaxID=2586979 RepID=UPI0016147F7E|nr:M48 family metalloprotease [Sphingomonas sp. BK069]MBB3348330.1 STE24 endopeptidase [Sphingomonas sp. BK069]